MANKKITELTAAGALTGTEPIEIVQGGVNKQTTTQAIANLATASGGPAIDEKYADIAALLADQGNQTEDALYLVIDASTDATVDAGWAVYQKLTATTGAIGDYRKLSEEESLDVVSGSYTAETFGDFIITLTGKTTPVNADTIVISDSEDNGDAKEVTLTNLKAFLKTYNDTLYAGIATDVIGVQDLYIPASAMWPKTTAGCAEITKSEIATSLLNIQTLDFDQTTQEHAQFTVVMPRKWNNGTVTVVFYWTASSGSGDVIWGIQGVANSNDDPLTTAFGTAVEVTDTLTATNDVCVTSATGAMTIAGTPADADFLGFQIYRKAADGSDTLSGDAKLLGISIRVTTDAGKDA